MKLIYRKNIVSILFVLVFFSMTSCSQDATTSLTTFIEKTTTTISTYLPTTSITTEIIDVNDYVTYTYSDDIAQEKKALFESENEVILFYLIDNNILLDQEITYYISNETYDYYNFKTEILWLYIGDYACKDNIFNTILAISDPMANYGLMYGLANYISRDLGYDYQAQVNPTSSMITFLSNYNNIDYFDITYPCFYDVYANGTQIEYSYEFAIQIADYIVENHGLSALVDLVNENEDLDKFENDFTMYINQWLAENDSDLILTPSEHPIVFAQEHMYNVLEWKTEHANWVIYNGFSEYNYYLTNFCVNCGYKSLVYVVTQLEEDMDNLDESIKLEGFQYPDLTIYFSSNISTLGYYFSGSIFIKTIASFAHEYVHYLTVPTLDSQATRAMHEWLACYFSYNAYFTKYANLREINNDFLLDEYFLDIFESHYSRDFDYIEDFFIYSNIHQYDRGNYDDVSVYNQGFFPEFFSFPAYFAETYGEDVLLAVMRDINSLDDLTGKTWDDIYSDWEQYILSNYSWLD